METIQRQDGKLQTTKTHQRIGRGLELPLENREVKNFLYYAYKREVEKRKRTFVFTDELKEAKWVKEERQRILSEAENRAEAIQKNAEETQMQLIDEHEITQAAYEQANELVNAAQQKSIEIKTDTDQYVDDVLNDVEHRLDLLLRKVREDRGYFNNN